MGIPTIRRVHGNRTTSYLKSTLQSLLTNIDPRDVNDVIFVVYLADDIKLARDSLRMELETDFKEQIAHGMIHVIEAPFSFYPKLKGLRRTLGDSSERMYWRAKQTMDIVYVMRYCENIARYYLHLEDDVKVTLKDYIVAIRRFIALHQQENWPELCFSEWGFIGKLFRAEDLDLVCRFMRLLYNDYPPDLILVAYIERILRQEGCGGKFNHKPALFEHIGLQSSSLGT